MPLSKESATRADLLAKLRAQKTPQVALPSYPANAIRYADPRAQFIDTLTGIGGRCEIVADWADAARRIAEEAVVRDAQHMVQAVTRLPFADERVVDLNAIDDPHALEWIDVAIMPGEFAVAENGAVWCTDAGLKHRVTYFLSQHVVVCVPARAGSQHARSVRASVAGRAGVRHVLGRPFENGRHRAIAGHRRDGARSLTVYLIESV
ncbi:MAG: hypothetical protein QM811_04430 [Pirellulales bacterium]